jgi:hypothetical protein
MGVKILKAFNELNNEEEYDPVPVHEEIKKEKDTKIEDVGTQFRLDSF